MTEHLKLAELAASLLPTPPEFWNVARANLVVLLSDPDASNTCQNVGWEHFSHASALLYTDITEDAMVHAAFALAIIRALVWHEAGNEHSYLITLHEAAYFGNLIELEDPTEQSALDLIEKTLDTADHAELEAEFFEQRQAQMREHAR